jgi:hypothetical protein
LFIDARISSKYAHTSSAGDVAILSRSKEMRICDSMFSIAQRGEKTRHKYRPHTIANKMPAIIDVFDLARHNKMKGSKHITFP